MFSVAGIAAAAVFLPGCYERVVGAKGMGAQGVSISEPNVPDGSHNTLVTQKKTLKLKGSP